MLHLSFVTIVPFKKQTLLKWRTTPPERDTRLPVNECSVTSLVLNETELCEDEKPIKSMDSSKPNEIHDELISNDSRTETLSDTDQDITEDNTITSQEDITEDTERTCEPVLSDSFVEESDATSILTEKPLHINTDTSTAPTNVLATSANLSPPGSPDPLVVDDSVTSHECGSHDPIKGDKTHTDQAASDVKSSGTDTPQQGKRKKVTMSLFSIF